MSHPVGAGVSLAVGIIAISLTALALAAWRRSMDRRLLFVALAFGTFACKGVLQFLDWRWDLVGQNAMEVVASFLDLTVVMLLLAPLLRR